MYSRDGGGRNKGFEKHSLLADFIACCPHYRTELTMHGFKRLLLLYCKSNGLCFNPHRLADKSRRDKSNGTEFYFICDERFDAGGKLERLHMQRKAKTNP